MKLNYDRKLIAEFCWKLQIRVNQYSLRSQIIAYYNSILKLLDQFPNVRYFCIFYVLLQISVKEAGRYLVVLDFQPTKHMSIHPDLLFHQLNYMLNFFFRDSYFVLGDVNEKKTDEDSLKGLQADSR